jgi:hypothetical protein
MIVILSFSGQLNWLPKDEMDGWPSSDLNKNVVNQLINIF